MKMHFQNSHFCQHQSKSLFLCFSSCLQVQTLIFGWQFSAKNSPFFLHSMLLMSCYYLNYLLIIQFKQTNKQIKQIAVSGVVISTPHQRISNKGFKCLQLLTRCSSYNEQINREVIISITHMSSKEFYMFAKLILFFHAVDSMERCNGDIKALYVKELYIQQ